MITLFHLFVADSLMLESYAKVNNNLNKCSLPPSPFYIDTLPQNWEFKVGIAMMEIFV